LSSTGTQAAHRERDRQVFAGSLRSSEAAVSGRYASDELLDTARDRQHARGLSPVQPKAALAFEHHEARLTQHLEVLGDAGRGEPRRRGELARGLCLHEARLHDPAPLLVCQRSEQLVETGVGQSAISVSRLPAGSRTCALTTQPLSVGGISTLPPLAVAAPTA
jgi:hypothetical protein